MSRPNLGFNPSGMVQGEFLKKSQPKKCCAGSSLFNNQPILLGFRGFKPTMRPNKMTPSKTGKKIDLSDLETFDVICIQDNTVENWSSTVQCINVTIKKFQHAKD